MKITVKRSNSKNSMGISISRLKSQNAKSDSMVMEFGDVLPHYQTANNGTYKEDYMRKKGKKKSGTQDNIGDP